MLALAEVGERVCWAWSAVTRKGGCMPHMYVDPYAILDVTYLVAAFLFDGHGEDGYPRKAGHFVPSVP